MRLFFGSFRRGFGHELATRLLFGFGAAAATPVQRATMLGPTTVFASCHILSVFRANNLCLRRDHVFFGFVTRPFLYGVKI